MATTATIPYTYFQCPCTSENATSQRNGEPGALQEQDEAEAERNFDPRAPRSCYNLYPLDHLLFCEDCQQIRCPKCIVEEITTIYCPNCLFEVPNSAVKQDGNRCIRSCFQCPICISPLSISSLENRADQGATTGPYVLNCQHCNWNSKEIGIKFERSQMIYPQLARVGGGGWTVTPNFERKYGPEGARRMYGIQVEDWPARQIDDSDRDMWHSNLLSFYQSQLEESSKADELHYTSSYGYGSPSSLSRIMGLYRSGGFDKKPKDKISVMREAQDLREGLKLHDPDDDSVQRLQKEGWVGTTSSEQRNSQPDSPLFVSDLRPIPYLLRTKRSKRCRICRHILSKPEGKVTSIRYRIRLAAQNYLPAMTITPLLPLTSISGSLDAKDHFLLHPLRPTQFLLTIRNPIFDPVKITLATPSHTPGRFGSKITILCPQFEIGANTDVWDEALKDGLGAVDKEKRRTTIKEGSDGLAQAEAGKVWDRGRNWVSVVMEVVPATLKPRNPTLKSVFDGSEKEREEEKEDEIGEDEDILEIPIFVRSEYEADVGEIHLVKDKDREPRERRELAYWCVLGLGRIAHA